METDPSDIKNKINLKRLIPSFAITPYRLALLSYAVFFVLLVGSSFVMRDHTKEMLNSKEPTAWIDISNESIPVDNQSQDNLQTAEEVSEDPTLKEDLSNDSTKTALPESPLPGVYEDSSDGFLPAVSKDGLKPYKAYAKPSKSYPNIPKISVILSEVGFSSAVNDKIISDMPNRLTLAVSPYVDNLNQLTNAFRKAGFEFLIELPVESTHFPKEDSGPYALLSHLEPSQNIKRLKWNMTRTTGYIGFVNFRESRLISISALIEPILDEIQNRGLIFADTVLGDQTEDNVNVLAHKISLPFVPITNEIDSILSEEFIRASFKELELRSFKEGHVVAYAHTSPLTLKLLSEWIHTLEGKGIALVPASAYDMDKNTAPPQPQSAETEQKPEDTTK